jgi:hypothetical protein
VGQLNASNSSLAVDKFRNAFQRLDVLVFPNSQIARGNATVRGDRRRFNYDQGDSADGSTSQMNQMPVIGKPILGAILAHWGHGDAIAEG